MALTLMYITNRPDVALVAEKYGVERIWVDLETLRKKDRQFGMNTVQSEHSVADVYKVREALTSSQLLVRINPWHEYAYLDYADSCEEIEAVIAAGAQVIMLPMWRTVGEVQKFIDAVDGRTKTVLLLETKEAEACLGDLLDLHQSGKCRFDEVHIGLNDLHLSYGKDFLFELLADGTVERICRRLKPTGIPYGFGGFAKLGDGAIPAEKIIMEHYRLGSTRAILSRTFCDNALIDDIDEIDRVFKWNMHSIREFERSCQGMSVETLEANRKDLAEDVKKVTVSIRKRANYSVEANLQHLVEENRDKRYIWQNKKILPAEDATINVLSPTAQFGANVFEGIRGYWNEDKKELFLFRLADHLKRFRQSLKMFGLDCPYGDSEIKGFITEIVKANGYHEDIAIRLTVYVDGFGNWASDEPLGMFIAPIAKSRKHIPLTEGQTAGISSWRRISDQVLSPHIKVGANYINSRMAQREALRNGYNTAIMLNDQGKVAEGPGSCLFMVKGSRLTTPPLSASILDSITRDTLMKLAEERGIPTDIRDIDRTELYICDEVFLCGSAAEITPIVSVDGYEVGDGMVGQISQDLHREYIRCVTGENEQHRAWVMEGR